MLFLAFNENEVAEIEADTILDAAVLVVENWPSFEVFIIEQAFQPGEQFYVYNL